MPMEHYPHQDPNTPALFEDRNGRPYVHASLVPSRVKSFTLGLLAGYSLAIIHMGTLIVLLTDIRK